MFDKTEMRTQEEITLRKIQEAFEAGEVRVSPDSQYKNCFLVYKDGRHILTIKTEPNFSNAMFTKIIANPTRWENFKEFQNSLSQLCDISKLELTRIDHATDLNMPISEVHKGIRISSKQAETKYFETCAYKQGDLTGFYIGKEPENYCIYDKGYHLAKNKKYQRNVVFPVGEMTRIELRQLRGKIKYRLISDLANYMADPPFSKVQFFRFKHLDYTLPEKARELEWNMKIGGFNLAFAKLNKQQNFMRDFKSYLEEVPLAEHLNEIYRENLKLFFGGI